MKMFFASTVKLRLWTYEALHSRRRYVRRSRHVRNGIHGHNEMSCKTYISYFSHFEQ